MAQDPLIREAEEAEVSAGAQARFADLFDLRRIIGGLLLVYGVVLFVLGLGASDEDIARAADVNINLWTGIGLTLAGALFIAWALLRPVGHELVADGDGDDALPGATATEEARGRPGGDGERTRGEHGPGREER